MRLGNGNESDSSAPTIRLATLIRGARTAAGGERARILGAGASTAAFWSWVVLHRAAPGGSGLLGLPLCGLLGLPLCGAVGTAAAACRWAAAVRRLLDRIRSYCLEAWSGCC